MLNVDDYVNENRCLLSASISAERKHQGLKLYPFVSQDGLFDVSLDGKKKRTNPPVTLEKLIELLDAGDPVARVRCKPNEKGEQMARRRKVSDLRWIDLRQQLIRDGVLAGVASSAPLTSGPGVGDTDQGSNALGTVTGPNISAAPDPLKIMAESFGREVAAALALSASERRERLRNAPAKPNQAVVTTTVYLRNPDVVAEVLLRANGACQSCNAPAPFNRASDGSPYLEVHHRKRLADGGDDTVQNAIALCPNCHRKEHYGSV